MRDWVLFGPLVLVLGYRLASLTLLGLRGRPRAPGGLVRDHGAVVKGSVMKLQLVARWVLVSSLCPVLVSAGESPAPSPQSLKAIAEGVREIVEDDEAVGAEVLILHRGEVVLHEAFGWSDLDRRTPLARDTIVCVRSMTKPLVGTAIQMLADENKLSLSDRASKYLPAFANDKSRAITIEQLLTHTAGFPLTLINKTLSSYSGQRAVADQAGEIGPSNPPGKFRYSDTDTETLAAIVSAVAGEPVDAFIRRRILEPLGMTDTFCVLGTDAPPRSRVSSNHAGATGLWHKYWDHGEKPFFPFFLGAAAMYSTTTDYARFMALWLHRGRAGGRQLLSEAAVGRALRPQEVMLSPGSNTPYPTSLKPLRPFYGEHWMVYVPPGTAASKCAARVRAWRIGRDPGSRLSRTGADRTLFHAIARRRERLSVRGVAGAARGFAGAAGAHQVIRPTARASARRLSRERKREARLGDHARQTTAARAGGPRRFGSSLAGCAGPVGFW